MRQAAWTDCNHQDKFCRGRQVTYLVEVAADDAAVRRASRTRLRRCHCTAVLALALVTIRRSGLLQGDRKRAARNKRLGVFELSGIAPQLRQVPQIMVAFDVDFSGIRVSAMDLRAGSAIPVTVSGETG